MADDVLICNLGLAAIGQDTIESIDEESNEAKQCKLIFDTRRDELLRAHHWNFAEGRVILALVVENSDAWEWAFAYQYPSGCLKVRNIVIADTTIKPPPFAVALSEDGSKKVIFTNEASPVTVSFTRLVSNPQLFDSQFVSLFADRLSIDLAMSVARDKDLQRHRIAIFNSNWFATTGSDAGEAQNEDPDDADWVAARGRDEGSTRRLRNDGIA